MEATVAKGYVWRVEDAETGLGPYQGTAVWRYRTHGPSTHPNPQQEMTGDPYACTWDIRVKDLIPEIGDTKWYCGFESTRALYSWFDREELNRLQELGYRIVCKWVNIVWKGKKQLIFTEIKETEE